MLKTKNILRRIEKIEEHIKPKEEIEFIYAFRNLATNKCNIMSTYGNNDFDKEYDSVEDYIKEIDTTNKKIKIFDFKVVPDRTYEDVFNN